MGIIATREQPDSNNRGKMVTVRTFECDLTTCAATVDSNEEEWMDKWIVVMGPQGETFWFSSWRCLEHWIWGNINFNNDTKGVLEP